MLATNLALLLLTVAQVANSVPASGPSCEPARNLVTSLKLAHAASESPVSGTRFPISDTYSFLSFSRSPVRPFSVCRPLPLGNFITGHLVSGDINKIITDRTKRRK